jgi:hypothetical protein
LLRMSSVAWTETSDEPRRPRPPAGVGWRYVPPVDAAAEFSVELASALPARITCRADFRALLRADAGDVLRALRRAPDARNEADMCALLCWSEGVAWLAGLPVGARVVLVRAATLSAFPIEAVVCTLQYFAPVVYVVVQGQAYIRDEFGTCVGILRAGDAFGDIAIATHVSLERTARYTVVAAGSLDVALLRRVDIRCAYRDIVNKKIEDNFAALRRTPGLSKLTEPRLKQLSELANLKRLSRDCVLVKEGDLVDYLIVVVHGTCVKQKRFVQTVGGGSVTYELALGEFGPGSLLGVECLSDEAARHSVTSAVTSSCCDVRARALRGVDTACVCVCVCVCMCVF